MKEHDNLSFNIAAKHVELVEGLTGTGKTQELLRAACNLIESGADPASLLIVGQSALACTLLKQQLHEMLPSGDLPTIITYNQLESQVLKSAAERQMTGRRYQMATGVDETILGKDLDTTGIPLNVIVRCKQKILKGWESGTPANGQDDPDLMRIKEELILCLEDLDAMMEEEAHYLAASIVTGGLDERLLPTIQHILVDDFHQLCRSSQIFVTSLASDSLFLAADNGPEFLTNPEMKHVPGLEEMAKLLSIDIRQLDGSYRSAAAISLIENMFNSQCKREVGTPDLCPHAQSIDGSLQVTSYETPTEEVVRTGEFIRNYLRDRAAALVAVTATNDIWLKNLQAVLEKFGVSYIDLSTQNAKGLDEDMSEAALLYELTSDPANGLLWRRWCAQNDPLANSSFFARHRHSVDRQSLSEALLQISDSDDTNTMTALEKKHFEAVWRQVEKARTWLTSCDNSKLASEDSVRQKLPIMPFTYEGLPAKTVLMGKPGSFDGLNPDLAMFIGAANGSLLPKNYFDLAQMEEPKRETCRRKAKALIYATLGKSMDQVVISYSKFAPLPIAQVLDLKVDRIELHDGQQMARLSLDEALARVVEKYIGPSL